MDADAARHVRRHERRVHGAGVGVGARAAALRRPRAAAARPLADVDAARAGGAARRATPHLDRRARRRADRRARRGAGGAPARSATRPASPRATRRTSGARRGGRGHPAHRGAARRGCGRGDALHAPGRRRRRRPVQGLPRGRRRRAVRRRCRSCSGSAWTSSTRTSYESSRPDGTVAFVHDFGFGPAAANVPDEESPARAVRGGVPRGVGAARREPTASTGWCCSPARLAEVAVLRALREYLRQAGSPFSQDYIEQRSPRTPRSRAAGRAVRDALSTRTRAGRPARSRGDHAGRRASARRSTRSRASTRTASCARSSRLVLATLRTNWFQTRRRRRARARASRSSSTRARSPTSRCRGRCSRSSCTRRGSRACTCASARSRAAGSAGPTGARTSAPRCSA